MKLSLSPELLLTALSGVLPYEVLTRAASASSMPVPSLLDELAVHVARSYACGDMTFEDADQIMNASFAVATSEAYWAKHEGTIPSDMFEVYQAFDEGEYFHPADEADVNPEIKHTKPRIERFLAARLNGLVVRLGSERCVLRPAQVGDLAHLVEAISDPKFPADLPLSDFYREGQIASWLDRACRQNATRDSAVWAIDLLSGESSIGQVSLIARAEDHALSFWLAPRYWGNGLAREALSAAIAYAFGSGKVECISAATAVWNMQSVKLLHALGFAEGSVLDAGYTANGIAHAVRQFSLRCNHSARSAATKS